MADWKKIIVSGSSAVLNSLTLDNALTVPNGGTGVNSLTDGGVLLGSGTNSITALGQATNGQLVIGSTGGDPVLSTLTEGTGVTISNTAGSIEISAVGSGGTVTGVSATGTVNGITLTSDGDTVTPTITLAGPLANVTNGQLSSNGTMDVGGVTLELGIGDATPAFDLQDATSYPGDSSLVTLGTITTGTWNGTAITMPYLNFGGTSTQFVKGDGTLDSNTYLTTTGNGSGLTNVDAETLDSLNSTEFLRSNAADTKTVGDLLFNDNVKLKLGTNADLRIYNNGSGTSVMSLFNDDLEIWDGTTSRFTFGRTTGDLSITGTFSGDGSSLTNVDAETLDSLNSTDFLRSNLADSFSVKYSGNGSSQIWMDNVSDVGLATVGHAFQIGQSSGINLRMDNNEIMCVNNGVADTLRLQRDGGNIFMFGLTSGVLDVNGNILASSFKTDGGTSTQFVKGDGTLDSSTYSTQTLTLGTSGQVPFMNGTTNFSYSSGLRFSSNQLLFAQTDAGIDASTSLKIRFGDINGDDITAEIVGFGGDASSNGIILSDELVTITSPDISIIGELSVEGEIRAEGSISSLEVAATSDTDKFLVFDSGVIKYRTGNEVRGDIGALKLVKALSVETIGASENILLWYTTEAITLESIQVAIS